MRGEPDSRTPTHRRGCRTSSSRRTHGIPDNRGEPRLRQAIAENFDRDNRLRYDPDSEILVTTGATFGIYAALSALLDDGDEVLVPDPVYDAYQSPIRLQAASRKLYVPSSKTAGFNSMSKRSTPRVTPPHACCCSIRLGTPSDALRRPELKAIGEFLDRRNLMLISDEIYEAITYNPPSCFPASLSEALRARTILVNSLSKRTR